MVRPASGTVSAAVAAGSIAVTVAVTTIADAAAVSRGYLGFIGRVSWVVIPATAAPEIG
jgi:hypothetical protein